MNGNIVLNVDIRTNTFDADAHSIWKLVREGDKTFRPGTNIEGRWWDSLIGKILPETQCQTSIYQLMKDTETTYVQGKVGMLIDFLH